MKALAAALVALVLLVPYGAWRRLAPAGPAPRADVGPQLRQLDAALDRLEERLLADQASVGLWEELRDRHETVSEVACKNLGEHAQEMARHTPPRRATPVAARVPAKKERVVSRAGTRGSVDP